MIWHALLLFHTAHQTILRYPVCKLGHASPAHILLLLMVLHLHLLWLLRLHELLVVHSVIGLVLAEGIDEVVLHGGSRGPTALTHG